MSSKGSQIFLNPAESGAMQSISDGLYEFDEFRLDGKNRVLLLRQEPVSLTAKAFDILLALVENEGQLLTKDSLMHAVWPDSRVEDANLTQTVFMLRKALGQTRDQGYIVTVPGRGYRFVADVRQVPREGPPEAENSAAIRPIEIPYMPQKSVRQRWPVLLRIAAVLIVTLAVALAAYTQWLRSRPLPERPAGRSMLAVLPFRNLTGDPAQDYFSDGMTEEMIAQLGNLDPLHLGVIARTSVMRYKSGQEQLDQIGRELGVQYVIEGSVRRDSRKVRITAQLILVKDQTHVWAREYDGEVSNLLGLQTEIAQEIADEIQTSLGDHRSGRPSRAPRTSLESYEGYDLYLKGQYFWNKRTFEGFQHSIDYYQQAIAKDPNSARAYAGLADTYALMGPYSILPQREFMPKARAAALRALEIDDNLPEAHTALALIVQNYDWDWQTSEKEFRRAIELNPNYATAHQWYAEHLAWRGRFEDALRESERARQLDPLSLIIATDNGAILYYSRQYDRAIARFGAVREMDPGFFRAGLMVFAYAQKGMFAEALQEVEGKNPKGAYDFATLAYIYGRSGQMAQARLAFEKLEHLNTRRALDPAPLIRASIGMGDTDQAFVWLEKAYSQRGNVMVTLQVDPLYDPLRSDPRFPELLRRVGLAQ
jgi:TolB-like protein/DNA-binding winged helix-turn-helix (wHTH) protein/Tfp pilus assembly protein PilF